MVWLLFGLGFKSLLTAIELVLTKRPGAFSSLVSFTLLLIHFQPAKCLRPSLKPNQAITQLRRLKPSSNNLFTLNATRLSLIRCNPVLATTFHSQFLLEAPSSPSRQIQSPVLLFRTVMTKPHPFSPTNYHRSFVICTSCSLTSLLLPELPSAFLAILWRLLNCLRCCSFLSSLPPLSHSIARSHVHTFY